MISQKCPKCLSERVRRGYRPTPIWSKVIFRYHLLCDNCNWEFIGFAVPGTVTARPTKRPKKMNRSERKDAVADDVMDKSRPDLSQVIVEGPVSVDKLQAPKPLAKKTGKKSRKSGV